MSWSYLDSKRHYRDMDQVERWWKRRQKWLKMKEFISKTLLKIYSYVR